jgi:hypothetical protein
MPPVPTLTSALRRAGSVISRILGLPRALEDRSVGDGREFASVQPRARNSSHPLKFNLGSRRLDLISSGGRSGGGKRPVDTRGSGMAVSFLSKSLCIANIPLRATSQLLLLVHDERRDPAHEQ